MNHAERIAALRRHREHLQNETAKRLGSANGAVQTATETLEALSEHRRGYQADLLDRARKGMSAAALRRQLLFLRSLGEAEDHQQASVESAVGERDTLRESLRGRYRDTQTLSRLETQLRQEKLREAQRRENVDQGDLWLSRQAAIA